MRNTRPKLLPPKTLNQIGKAAKRGQSLGSSSVLALLQSHKAALNANQISQEEAELRIFRGEVQFAFYKSWVVIAFPFHQGLIDRLRSLPTAKRRYLPISKMWAVTYPFWKWNAEGIFIPGKSTTTLNPTLLDGASEEELLSLPIYEGSYGYADDPENQIAAPSKEHGD